MTVRLEDPHGRRWTVRRSLLHGRDGRGRRLRWRGPHQRWLDALKLVQVAELGDVPVIGLLAVGVAAAVVVAVLLVFLPFVALGLLEALLLAVLFTGAAVAATTFGRPILVRAERQPGSWPDGDGDGDGGPDVVLVWAVRGWRASRDSRNRVVEVLKSGLDPISAMGGDATLIAPDPGRG